MDQSLYLINLTPIPLTYCNDVAATFQQKMIENAYHIRGYLHNIPLMMTLNVDFCLKSVKIKEQINDFCQEECGWIGCH